MTDEKQKLEAAIKQRAAKIVLEVFGPPGFAAERGAVERALREGMAMRHRGNGNRDDYDNWLNANARDMGLQIIRDDELLRDRCYRIWTAASEQNDPAIDAVASGRAVPISPSDLALLRRDAARLDFLENRDRVYWVEFQRQPDGDMQYAGQGFGLREAIDAAMLARNGE